MDPLPPDFTATREAIRAVACFVISPARLARTGHIALAPSADGGAIGTPPGDPAPWIGVRGDQLIVDPGRSAPLTTVRDAAAFVGGFTQVALRPDPAVGHDLPPYRPDVPLAVDAASSRVLAAWYAYGAAVHAELLDRHHERYSVIAPQLCPEHFDLAIAIDCGHGSGVNVGFSGGDTGIAEPYLYVGPWDRDVTAGDDFWDTPFGRTTRYDALRNATDPVAQGADAVDEALRRLGFI